MDDHISRKAAIEAVYKCTDIFVTNLPTMVGKADVYKALAELPSAEPTLRERALMLLLNWAEECGFGYDNFPEEYERYKYEIADMSYFDGMIYIAEKEVERNG